MQTTQDEHLHGQCQELTAARSLKCPHACPGPRVSLLDCQEPEHSPSCHCSSIQAYQASHSCTEGGTVLKLMMLTCQLWPFPINESCDFLSHHC